MKVAIGLAKLAQFDVPMVKSLKNRIIPRNWENVLRFSNPTGPSQSLKKHIGQCKNEEGGLPLLLLRPCY